MKKTVRNSKEEHWWRWIENANSGDLWNINRFQGQSSSDGSKERIPPLKTNCGLAQTNEEKASILSSTFFPPPPSLAPTKLPLPSQQLPDWRPFTTERIRHAASRLKRDKAPGPDGIPNAAIQEALPSIVGILAAVFNAAVRLRRIPKQWKESTTVVLRKPGKPAYNVAKAYRPIALLNTIGKLLSALLAEDLTYLCEQYKLLPNTQFGGRPGRTTTDALHLITHEIKKAWRAGKVASALFLDIQAAFPNVVKPVLMENMKKKGIPEAYVCTIENMLTNRSTRLKFDGSQSDPIAITNGNSQGCPLSMILYLFYISPLLEISNQKDELTIGKIKDMMERMGGVLDWPYSHNSPLETNKLALIDFTRSPDKRSESTPLSLVTENSNDGPSTVIINPSQTYKLLGVILDQQLQWNKHQELVHSRAVKWTALFSRIHRVARGLPLRMGRQLYQSVAIPRIQYAADIWFTPPHNNARKTRRTGSVAIIKKLQSVQRKAAIGITGAMRTTAGDVLNTHINLPPIDVTLNLACQKAAARLMSLPQSHPLAKPANRAAKGKLQRHNTPMHQILHATKVDVASIESINPALKDPNRPMHFRCTIDASREKAIERDKAIRTRSVAIYTDGSGMEGKIGAAAVLYQDGRRVKAIRHLLGKDTEHTVHEGELVGIALGLHLAKTAQGPIARINISLDNQAAILKRSQP
ncbi:hypothetical protein PIIN_10390 [Serendipita indica DSM 11827]|uniref:RNase H type-1 domain-containing protein n=1 Tax=Serendipita indica (strain DSM 11827) TaxID=1109443 RepID=G4TYK4_SERID|nr:hypothetical protein PIIN_10390 [Serendipita indica DSM 11827]